MTQLTHRGMHADTMLSNFSIAQIQSSEGFLATKVFGIVPVDHQSDKYWVFPQHSFLRDDFERRAPATESAGSGYDLSQDQYYCNKWALHKDVPDEDIANADDGLEPIEDARAFLTAQALQRLEREWTTTFFHPSAAWTTKLTATGGGTSGTSTPRQWNDYTNSDPFLDLRLLARSFRTGSGGMRPNIAVLGFDVYQALLDHPKIIERVKYVNGGFIDEPGIAKALGVQQLYIADGVGMTSGEGLSPVVEMIQGKHVLFAYRAPGQQVGRRQAAAGKTFVWRKLNGENLTTQVYQFYMKELKATRVECEMAFDMKITAPDLGYMVVNAVA